jgi:hypothetical protein
MNNSDQYTAANSGEHGPKMPCCERADHVNNGMCQTKEAHMSGIFYVNEEVFAGPEEDMDKLMLIRWNMISVNNAGDIIEHDKIERIGPCSVKITSSCTLPAFVEEN